MKIGKIEKGLNLPEVQSKKMFKKGSFYTRDEIHDKLGGGSKESYLPTVDGQVIAACFKTSEDMNPDAPRVILSGTGKIVESTAEQFAKQKYAVPTFIKRDVGRWKYVGNYKVHRHSSDEEEISRHSKKARRKDKVTSVLFLIEEK